MKSVCILTFSWIQNLESSQFSVYCLDALSEMLPYTVCARISMQQLIYNIIIKEVEKGMLINLSHWETRSFPLFLYRAFIINDNISLFGLVMRLILTSKIVLCVSTKLFSNCM
jgi:hypothetical protein